MDEWCSDSTCNLGAKYLFTEYLVILEHLFLEEALSKEKRRNKLEEVKAISILYLQKKKTSI